MVVRLWDVNLLATTFRTLTGVSAYATISLQICSSGALSDFPYMKVSDPCLEIVDNALSWWLERFSVAGAIGKIRDESLAQKAQLCHLESIHVTLILVRHVTYSSGTFYESLVFVEARAWSER